VAAIISDERAFLRLQEAFDTQDATGMLDFQDGVLVPNLCLPAAALV
jgi:hypothetical protein